MKQQNELLFNDKDEEFINLLMGIGTRKPVAQLLVFLANRKEATSDEIERGTDLRQPYVSTAAGYLIRKGWVKSRNTPSLRKGRQKKDYSLALPMKDIVATMEKIREKEVNNKLALIERMKEYLCEG